MSDYGKGYKEGFDAGIDWYKNFLEEQAKKYTPPRMPSTPGMEAPWNTTYHGCWVCGREGPDLMVCYNNKCPSRVTC
jgi:hypothetical protein